MKTSRLIELVRQSVRRNRLDFVLSSIGIAIGIGTLIFFTALGVGVRTTVLEKIFVITQIEVVKPSFDVGGFQTEGLFGGKKLNDRLVTQLQRIPGVAGVYPRMRLTFPSSVRGGKEILGKDMVTELIADGIPAELVTLEEGADHEFKDWEAISCEADSACPESYSCVDGTCQGKTCDSDAECQGGTYCEASAKTCAMPIPVIISPSLLEIYNGSIQTAMGGARGALSKLPKLSESALIGFQMEGVFGRSFLGSSKSAKLNTRKMRLVGFSDKALGLGVTMPLGYVERLNAEIGGEKSSQEFHSILVEATSNDEVANIALEVTEGLGYALSSKYQNAERAGLLILLITLIFNLVSFIFLAIAAINIMHTFMMIILERKRELALMRAVGATRASIRGLVLGEATLLGFAGALAGIVLSLSVSAFVDYALGAWVRPFPYKPESLFVYEWWMFALALAVSLFFCALGALLPAIRASRIEPAQALAGH